MAHHMDDLCRIDLFSRGWMIQDRLMLGASGREHYVAFVVGDDAAPVQVPKEFVQALSDDIVNAKQAGQDSLLIGHTNDTPGVRFDLTHLTLTEDFRGRDTV